MFIQGGFTGEYTPKKIGQVYGGGWGVFSFGKCTSPIIRGVLGSNTWENNGFVEK